MQRECACGGTTGSDVECAECRDKRPTLQRRSNSRVEPNVPPVVHEVLRSPGQPLDTATRAVVESRFGHDFGRVRVHADARAAESARTVNAQAYTVGNHIAFGSGQYQPQSSDGKQLLAHELAHVVQQSRQTHVLQPHLTISSPGDPAERQARSIAERFVAGSSALPIDAQATEVLMRQEFTPWPGQIGADVAGTRQQTGGVISERIQRTGDPNYAPPQPILLEFNHNTCTELTSTMEINFVHPAEPSARLSAKRFDRLKSRILAVANERLNGWISIHVGSEPACDVCRGRAIAVRVVAREGSSGDASTVELRRGTGRANAGRIFEGGDNWLTALLGGVSDGTLWHEAGHIVLGAPDEYPTLAGDPPRPRERINTRDWSAMSTVDTFGGRALMHPRHFSFMPAWLRRRFPDCTFNLIAQSRPIVIDVVAGITLGAASLGGVLGFSEAAELAIGIPLDQQRRFRLLVGAHVSMIAGLEFTSRSAYLAGALVGLDYSRNRSAGGLGIRADLRLGGANLDIDGQDPERDRWVPTGGGSLGLGYFGPRFELGATGGVGTALAGPFRGDPYFLLGLRAGLSF